jgi:hypothetical protein
MTPVDTGEALAGSHLNTHRSHPPIPPFPHP